jgi:xanthine dehydrogenase accessory factor
VNLESTACLWLAEGRPAVVVEVAAHRGSVPREAGTRMLVAEREVQGTIGGGHLELRAIADARRLLRGESVAAEQHIPLGPALGQCCGGAVTLRLQPLSDSRPTLWALPEPSFTLQLYGAGHVGRAIVRLLEGIACRVQWIDEREDQFPAGPSAAHIERLCVEPVEAEVSQAPPGAFYLVLTHSHDLDLAITQAVLKRGDFGWLGLIGSKTKRQRFVHRLESRGIATEALARLTCPIGLPGISGKEPEVIAVAVVAQLLSLGYSPSDSWRNAARSSTCTV